jgi:hypothetical protein
LFIIPYSSFTFQPINVIFNLKNCSVTDQPAD